MLVLKYMGYCADQVPAGVRLFSGKGEAQHEREGSPDREGGVEVSLLSEGGTLVRSCVLAEKHWPLACEQV